MQLRSWQQKIIDELPSIMRQHRRFILKAPTGAGKTVLASEIIEQFYQNKKIIVLCHRLVLLEQLENAFKQKHRVRKLEISDTSEAFKDYEILLSTNMRAKDILTEAIPMADLIIVDEAHRVSPNGTGYKKIISDFVDFGKPEAHFIGLTASPERRTGDQRDQLHLAFDTIIDCADIEKLIDEGILVQPIYRPHFVHDLDLNQLDISTGDFPVSKLASAIIKSSMIDYAMISYAEERVKVTPKPISAWFCPDITIAEATLETIKLAGINASIVTASTPLNERMKLLKEHENGEIEAMVSVGVLAEGWDNPHCNIIVHLRPTLSKVLWGQSVGRGLRSAQNKEKCIVIDVSSNWSTFGPVEKLQWSLWSHRKSYLQYKNRLNWIGQQQTGEENEETYLLCTNKLPNKLRCSYIYKKKPLSDSACPLCGSFSAIDIYREQNLNSDLNETGLHQLFFKRVEAVYEKMDLSVWDSLGDLAWKNSDPKEKVFLSFCMAFQKVSGEPTESESEFWNIALSTEAQIRSYLVEKNIQIVKEEEFEYSLIADGIHGGKKIRTVQSNYGVSLCGGVFQTHDLIEIERKYQKALKIAERLVIMGCSKKDNLPYFNAAEYLATKLSS